MISSLMRLLGNDSVSRLIQPVEKKIRPFGRLKDRKKGWEKKVSRAVGNDEAESGQQGRQTDGLWEMTLPGVVFVLAATDHMWISSQGIGVGDPVMEKKVRSWTQ